MKKLSESKDKIIGTVVSTEIVSTIIRDDGATVVTILPKDREIPKVMHKGEMYLLDEFYIFKPTLEQCKEEAQRIIDSFVKQGCSTIYCSFRGGGKNKSKWKKEPDWYSLYAIAGVTEDDTILSFIPPSSKP